MLCFQSCCASALSAQVPPLLSACGIFVEVAPMPLYLPVATSGQKYKIFSTEVNNAAYLWRIW